METNRIFNRNRTFFRVLLLVAVIAFTGGALLFPPVSAQANTEAFVSSAPGSFAPLAEKASPSVVNISTVKVIKSQGVQPQVPFGPDDPFKDFFERFFGGQMPKNFKQRSLGTGFIIDEKGYIITNNHVVENTDEIKVKLYDKTEVDAEIVGRDSKTDLALLRIKTDSKLTAFKLGNSDSLKVGDWVMAIGNPYGLGNTVTAGIVSAKYRQIGAGPYDNFIQTDAPINPGNSGGPLLNTAGEVVGINTAIYSRSGGSVGIGFAIPVNMAKDLLPQLKEGKVVRGWLGVMIQKISSELMDKFDLKSKEGALVADVTDDGPAEKAGIKRGDVIVSFDGKDVKESDDLPYVVANTPVGKKVEVEVIRKGKVRTIEVKIGELEEKAPALKTETEFDMGLSVEELTPELARKFGLSEEKGIVVVNVDRDSPAGEGGIMPGDIIMELDQKPLETVSQFNDMVESYKGGDTILFLVKRRDSTIYLTVKIAEK